MPEPSMHDPHRPHHDTGVQALQTYADQIDPYPPRHTDLSLTARLSRVAERMVERAESGDGVMLAAIEVAGPMGRLKAAIQDLEDAL